MGLVNGRGIKALGGEQFQQIIGAQQIERAHLGHHVGGDGAHHHVEPGLRVLRLRHDFAQTPKQHTRTSWRALRH